MWKFLETVNFIVIWISYLMRIFILGLMSSLSGILSNSHFLMNIHIPNMPAIYSRTYRKDLSPHGGVQPARVIETQLYKTDCSVLWEHIIGLVVFIVLLEFRQEIKRNYNNNKKVKVSNVASYGTFLTAEACWEQTPNY